MSIIIVFAKQINFFSGKPTSEAIVNAPWILFTRISGSEHTKQIIIWYFSEKINQWKIWKYCAYQVILFVSTEGAPKGGKGEGGSSGGEGYYGGSGGKLEEVWQALEGTEPIFIMVVCILVVVAFILSLRYI